MEPVIFRKVNQLPESLEPNSFYFVEDGDNVAAYITTSSGESKQIGRSDIVNESQSFDAEDGQTEFMLSFLTSKNSAYTVTINGLIQPEDSYTFEENKLIFFEELGEGDTVVFKEIIREIK